MSGWKDIVGHGEVIRYMENTVKTGIPSHAYIISGNPGSGKSLLARTFSMALQCTGEDVKPCMECHSCRQAITHNQPDIVYVTHEKPRSIGVDEIRDQLVDDIAIKPYNSRYKIYIIEEAEKMTEAAQNALLKTLEEPPEYGVIMLITDNAESLLPTIRSRCILLKLRNLKDSIIRKYLEEHMDLDDATIRLCTAYSQGSLGRAISLAESEDFKEIRLDAVRILKNIDKMNIAEIIEAIKTITDHKLDIEDLLDIMTVWYRDVMMIKATNDINKVVFADELSCLREKARTGSYEGIETILSAVKTAQKRLKANVNFELTIELLLLTIREN